MLCREVIGRIEEVYPRQYAMNWDNVGLLAGRMDKEVKRIWIALDLTDEVLDEAVRWNADMILTHHPLIFSPLHKVTDEDFIGKRVVKLIRHDIAYYAMHTNYDVIRMAELAAIFLNMKQIEVLEPMAEDGKGIGAIGIFSEKMTLGQCCKLVKETFRLDAVKVFGEKNQEIQTVAVCPGSGKSVIKTAMQKHADVLITGDIGHHEGIDAVAGNLNIIDAGHYGLEHIYMEDMKEFLQQRIPEMEIRVSDLKSPFCIC